MITPEVIAALIASGRPFEITPEGGLIVDAPDNRSRAARKQAAYRARKAVTNGNATVTESNKVTEKVTTVTQPSPSLPPSPLSPTPPIPTPTHTPPPTLSPRAHEEALSLEGEEPRTKSNRFTAPTLTDWTSYAATLTPPLPELEASNAWNFYTSKGWKVGNQAMKNWQAACRTCHGRWRQEAAKQHSNRPPHKPKHPAYTVEGATAGLTGAQIGDF